MATDDQHALTLYDWAEILDLGDALVALQDGTAYPLTVRADIETRRTEYPDLPLDYIQALDGMLEYVVQIEEAIGEQNDALAEFSQVLAEMGWGYSWDHDRLLTEAERDGIRAIQAQIEEEIGRQHARAEELADEIAAIEAMIEELEEQAEESEGQIEDIQSQIEELESELEDLDL